MPIGILFWVIFVVWVLFTGYNNWPKEGNFGPFGGTLVLAVLIGLLGWKVFGALLQ